MPVSEPNDVAEAESAHEWGVLSRLLDDSHPWCVDEMVRSREDAQTTRLDTIDAINRLSAEGLIHHSNCGLLFPTRAAVYLGGIVA
jgi:hypothetical protein